MSQRKVLEVSNHIGFVPEIRGSTTLIDFPSRITPLKEYAII
jgi:hypothetical protein